jgi:hypothetical protein
LQGVLRKREVENDHLRWAWSWCWQGRDALRSERGFAMHLMRGVGQRSFFQLQDARINHSQSRASTFARWMALLPPSEARCACWVMMSLWHALWGATWWPPPGWFFEHLF